MNNSLCLGVVSQRIIRAVATAVLLYGYRHTVVWRSSHCWMATATQLYGFRHTVGWLPPYFVFFCKMSL